MCSLPSRLLLAAALFTACTPAPSGGNGPTAIFGTPTPSLPLPLEQYPWPIDFALTSNGISVSVPDFGEERDPSDIPMSTMAAQGLAARHGFSGTAGIVFPFDGDIAPAGLPANGAASVLPDSSVFLLGLTGPDAGKRLPVRTPWRADERRLFVIPDHGQRLLPGETYAAVVTTRLKGANGSPVQSSAGFRTAVPLPTTSSLPFSQPTKGAVLALFEPLITRLEAAGMARADIAVATVLTIDRPEVEMAHIHQAVLDEGIPLLTQTRLFPEANYSLDRLFGVPPQGAGPGVYSTASTHDHVAHVVHGTFHAPLFNSDAPGRNGLMEFLPSGLPQVKGHEDIPFTLALPKGTTPGAAIPLVVYQHGLGGDRSDVFAVANELCGRGYAVAGMDLPFHGSRAPPAPPSDRVNNQTGESAPDGIGDSAGVVPVFTSFGITSDTLGVPNMTPMIVRDSLRQGVADAFTFVHALLHGNLAPLLAGTTGFTGSTLDASRMFWLSESYGSIHGVTVFASEPLFKGAAFSVGGGGLVVDTLLNSPTYAPSFSIFIYQRMGLSHRLTESLAVDYVNNPPEQELGLHLFQQIIDAADPQAFTALIARVPPNGVARSALFMAPLSDESVPAQGEQALAAAAGAVVVRVGGREPDTHWAPMTAVDAPVDGNVAGQTVAFLQYEPAAHDMLTRVSGQAEYVPGFPPFVKLDQPVHFQNPTGSIQRTVGTFFDGLAAGSHVLNIVP